MNGSRLFCAAAMAAATLVPMNGAAQGHWRQTPGSRITVTECRPHMHTEPAMHPWIDPYGYWHASGPFPYSDGFLAIDYANEAHVAATEVEFGLVARGMLIAIANDKGTFSPHVPIAHEFVVSREIFPVGTEFPYCAVLRVKYQDGTEWHNPNPPEAG